MRKFGVAVATQLLLLAPVAIAQRGQVDNLEPGKAAAAKVSELSAQEFLTRTAEANQFEIDASKMAVQQAKKKEVKELAEALVSDHTAAAEKLKAAMQADGTLALPNRDKPDAKQAQILDSLLWSAPLRVDSPEALQLAVCRAWSSSNVTGLL